MECLHVNPEIFCSNPAHKQFLFVQPQIIYKKCTVSLVVCHLLLNVFTTHDPKLQKHISVRMGTCIGIKKENVKNGKGNLNQASSPSYIT